MKGCCIWCGVLSDVGHIEHIVPEALGCPKGFILGSEWVCRKCNNNLAYLDRTVVDDFDFLLFMSGIPRKRGRPPVIKSRGNVRGTTGAAGPELFFNMDSHGTVAHDGAPLAGFRGRPRDISADFERLGLSARISFSVEFGRSKEFIRGIYKIAFSALTYFLKNPEPYEQRYDAVRRFVKDGEGIRHVMLLAASDKSYRHDFRPPAISQAGEYVIDFRLGIVHFLVDLSPTENNFAQLIEHASEALKGQQWTVLPTGDPQ